MRKKLSTRILALSLALVVVLIWGCVETTAQLESAQSSASQPEQKQKATADEKSPEQIASPAKPKEKEETTQEQAVSEKKASQDPYAQEVDSPYKLEVKPLTTAECARCHLSTFETIKQEGGKHKRECRFCHEQYHTYRPYKSWEEAVPQCVNCHGTIHGKKFKACMSCHQSPHAPIASMVDLNRLEKDCSACHTEQQQATQKHKSAHTEVACSSCHHSQHGNIPKCTECHAQPHAPYNNNQDCLGCHPAHTPNQISYGKQVNNNVCAGCHGDINQKLEQSKKKHSQLSCVYCHKQQHGFVPACQDCHGEPHSKAMLSAFEGCTDCHGEPHALILPNQ